MARIEKYTTGIVGVIKHNIREFKDGICPTNSDVDPDKLSDNYFIMRRGDSAAEIEKYRKQIEAECFHYKRKNIVHANEVVCTLPADCPPDQERKFFEESYKYICSTLPMDEKCVFLAEVHADESKVGMKHMHVMYVPAVLNDTGKHEGYEYRLCSDQLTRRSVLLKWHDNYQSWLDQAGVNATVKNGATSGRGISVKAMKEITKETGLTVQQIKDLEKENQRLLSEQHNRDAIISSAKTVIASKESTISQLQSVLSEKDITIDNLHSLLKQKDVEISSSKATDTEMEHLVSELQLKLQSKDSALEHSREQNQELQQELNNMREAYKQKEQELAQAQEQIKELETSKTQDNTWGDNSSWGSEKSRSWDEEHVW